MYSIIEILPGQTMPPSETTGKVQAIDQSLLDRHAPDAHYMLWQGDDLRARCSIWATLTPRLADEPVGVVGHYAAADVEAGATALRHACQQLAARGLRRIVGPMDGSTWRRYRLLTLRGSEPPFFLEPDNPDDWPSHFEAAGFAPLSRYFSALNDDLTVIDPRVDGALARMQAEGVAIRSLDASRPEEDLKAVHKLSLEAFAGNYLYTPISQGEFLDMYAPLCPYLRPELLLLAEKGSDLVGFIFGFPDFAQGQRGQTIDTAIAKSLAVRPGRAGAGLGTILLDLFQQAARRLNYKRVIHALMHENNRSRKISAHFGRPFREYVLYGKGTGA